MVVEREREIEREIWGGKRAGGLSRTASQDRPERRWSVVSLSALPLGRGRGGEILLMCLTVPAVRLLRRSDKTPNKEL